MPEPKKSRREILEQVLAQKPHDAFARYGLALECMNSGDSAAADAHFRQLLDANRDYVAGYLMYGQLLARESRIDEAKFILTTGIAAASKAGNAHAQSEMQSLLDSL
jgi:cytochrome c-type biogenesis protein CcmH/NrfG